MNHLKMVHVRRDNRTKLAVPFLKSLLLSLFFTAFAGISSFAQDRSGKTISCPAACPGTCWYVIDLIKDPPDKHGCFNAHLNLFYGSTGEKCLADIDRSFGGSVKYTLCDTTGGKGEDCELSDKNFPDGSPNPYPPGSTPDDSTKVVLSAGCYGAIEITFPADGTSGITYNFNGISAITADFDMLIRCMCIDGDTITDTLEYEYGIVHDADEEEEEIRDGEDGREDGDGGRIIIDNGDQDSENGPKIDHAETIQNQIGYRIESIYPNPVVDVLNVRMTIDQAEEFQFTIVDDRGNWMQNDVINLPPGENDIPINLRQNLESGRFYYFLIHRESGKFSTTKIYME